MTNPISIIVSSGVAISAKSTSMNTGDHVGIFNLASQGGGNAGLNVVSSNTKFSACEVSGHETGHGTLKVSHVNPSQEPTLDANAAAISIDLQASMTGGETAAQGIFVKSTTGGTSGKIINYVDSDGETIFALLPDGSLLLSPLPAPPAGTKDGLKLCNVKGTLGAVDSTGKFIPCNLRMPEPGQPEEGRAQSQERR